MRRLSKSKRLLFLLFSFIFLFQTINVKATIGNVSIFVYSDDYFSGDKAFVNKLSLFFRASGHSILLENRPKAVYGMQQYLKNSESIYISCHGIEEGSVMILDIVNSSNMTYFRSFDVPGGMDCKFAYISVCYGAKSNTVTGKNLCSTLISNGYKAAVGYNTSVKVSESRIYEETFYKYLARGKSVYEARLATEEELGDKYSKIISSAQYFGNLGLIP